MEKVVNVRKDLNDMVKGIGMKLNKGRYRDVSVCEVKFFNDKVITFSDDNHLFDLLKEYQEAGLNMNEVIKSKKLVEEIKTSKVDAVDSSVEDTSSTYFCVLYELSDGSKFRLFAQNGFVSSKIINLYYDQFKKQNSKKVG